MMYWLRLCQLEINNAVARTVCDGPYVVAGDVVAPLKSVTEMAQKKLKRLTIAVGGVVAFPICVCVCACVRVRQRALTQKRTL
jgi:hypothetical protein